MTTLTVTTAAFEGLGRQAAASTNPRYNPAFLSGGGILGWFGRTGLLKSLIARKADRDLRRAMLRLSKTSPHLLADVSRLDIPLPAGEMPRTARPPVALRPAQRPAIAASQRAAVSAMSKVPALAAGKALTLAQ